VNALSTKRWDEARVCGQHAQERFRALLVDSVVRWVCVCIKITVTMDLESVTFSVWEEISFYIWIMTRLWSVWQGNGVIPGRGKRLFVLHRSHTGCGSHVAKYALGAEGSCLWGKVAGHEDDHSLLSSVDFMNGWSCATHICCYGMCRDNLKFGNWLTYCPAYGMMCW